MALPKWNFRVTGRLGLAVVSVCVVLALAIALHHDVEPRDVAAWLASQKVFVGQHPGIAIAAYIVFYVAFAGLSLPGAWAVSVAGGALFGPWLGVPLVALSSTAGATVAMLASRYLFRDIVTARCPDLVERVSRSVAQDGARWLFAARLTPVLPFFAINIAVGLTRMPSSTFALVTCVGVFPLSLVYALAGAQFAKLERASDVFNVQILLPMVALAAATLLAKTLWRLRTGLSPEPFAGNDAATK
jgi:uncharacterized membrane protein YdjX (TVP38/TMEM64 family)